MTLIAQFGVNGAPLLIGDVLLSSNYRTGLKTNLPFVGDINEVLGRRGCTFQVRFKQKLNVLSERFVVAWCGSAEQAERALRVLQAIASQPGLNLSLIQSELDAIDPSAINQLQLVGVLLGETTKEQRSAHCFALGVQPIEIPPIGTVFAAGTGREGFLKILAAADWTNSKTGNDYQVAHTLLGALTNQEYRTDDTISNRWGGGFEAVTCSQKSGHFEKVGDILHTFWKLTEEVKDSVQLIPMFYKTTYWKDALVIRSTRLENERGILKAVTNDVDIILPLLKDADEYDLAELGEVDFSYRAICCHVMIQKKQNRDILFLIEQRADKGDQGVILNAAHNKLHISDSIVDAIKEEHSKSASRER